MQNYDYHANNLAFQYTRLCDGNLQAEGVLWFQHSTLHLANAKHTDNDEWLEHDQRW